MFSKWVGLRPRAMVDWWVPLLVGACIGLMATMVMKYLGGRLP